MKTNTQDLAKELSTVAHSNPTAEGMFTELNARERFRQYTNLSFFKKQLIHKSVKFVETDYLGTLKKLESLGVGTMVYGRRGNPDRFQWYYSLKDIAKMALEGKELEPKEIDIKVPTKAKGNRKIRVSRTDKGAFIQIIIPRALLKHIKTVAA